MKTFDVLVIGGGPAGIQSAISARNTDPSLSIGLIRREDIMMIPCGIPYIVSRLNAVEENILPDVPLEKNNVELIIGNVVQAGDHTVTLEDGSEYGYKKAILATGSSPVEPKIPGADKQGVYFIRKDHNYLRTFREAILAANKPLIVGGGYIGVEVADECLRSGKDVTLVEMLPHLLGTTTDPEFGDAVKSELESCGGKILTGVGVKEFTGEDMVTGAILTDGSTIDTDLVVLSVGYKPNLKIAEMFGVDIDPFAGIIVDENMHTSQPDISAAGDCAANSNFYNGKRDRVMLASSAMAQGRIAGSNLHNISVLKSYHGTLGSFSTKVNNLAIGATGLTEQAAKELGIQYIVGTADTMDRHPGKLAGTSKMHIKLLFAKNSHTLIGAQMSGGDSIGELVNMLAVMIIKKMTDMEIDMLQIGTHPLLTSSPIAYPVLLATVNAIMKWYKKE